MPALRRVVPPLRRLAIAASVTFLLANVSCQDATAPQSGSISIVPRMVAAQVSPVAFDSVHVTITPVPQGQIDQVQPPPVVDMTIPTDADGSVAINLRVPLPSGREQDFYAYIALLDSQGYVQYS